MYNPGAAYEQEMAPLPLKGMTDGVLAEINLSRAGIRYSSEGHSYPPVLLGGNGAELAQALMRNADTPFLPTQLSAEGFLSGEANVNQRFLNLTQFSLREHPLQSHFVKFGRGSATWYGFLTNNRDPSLLIERGKEIIEIGSQERKNKRLKPFLALEKLYENKNLSNEQEADNDGYKVSKKIILGAGTLTVIAVGGAITYVLQKKKQQTL